jgi:hypothetical protein
VTSIVNGTENFNYKTVISAGKILSIDPVTDNGKHRINFTENLELTKDVINHTLISVGYEND